MASRLAWVNQPVTGQVPVKDVRWISPRILQLFSAVETKDDFEVVTKVWWIYYFAYCRGEDKERRKELLQILVRPSMKVWDDEWEDIWHVVHNGFLIEFSAVFTEYMEKWSQSPAGVVHDTNLRKKVNAKGRKPMLSEEDVEQLYDAGGKKTYAGIKFDSADVCKVFRRLLMIAPTSPVVKVAVRYIQS